MVLETEIAGIKLKNPVTTASGTFGYGSEMSDLIDVSALGGFFTKAVTLEPRTGNACPRVYETPAGMLNAIGLANVGVEKFIEEKTLFFKNCGTNVFVNVAGSGIEDYSEVIERLNDVPHLAGYELNISCPNVKEGGIAFGSSPGMVEKVVKRAKSVSKRPLIVKMSPNVSDITETSKAAEAAGADALSLINTLIGMAVDIGKKKPVLANITGGLSGPAIKPVGLAMVYKVYKSVKIPLIGIGGIMDTSDALEYIMSGAAAVQTGTVNFVDPSAPIGIAEGLADYCKSNGVRSVRELTGCLHA
ncbi:MAG: dihydroorotate dehydrogenase [Fibrobacterota bacterium]